MTKDVIAREVAEQEFENFLEGMDIKIRAGSDSDAAVLDARNIILDAICEGHLVFSDDSEPVFTPYRKRTKHKEPITFREWTGADMITPGGKASRDQNAEIQIMMASITGVPKGTFASMARADYKIATSIMLLLMV